MPKLRGFFWLAGLAILAGGVLGFVLVIAYTVYAFADPHASYGLHIPILGCVLLGTGLLGGGALLMLAKTDRRVERLEAAMSANNPRS